VIPNCLSEPAQSETPAPPSYDYSVLDNVGSKTKTTSKAMREVAADFNQLRLFIRHAARIDVATARGSPSGIDLLVLAQVTFVPPSR
jgi:hypothetical protein